MLLDFDSAVNEVFFSKRVCLVEGDTEVAAIEAIARKLAEMGKISWDEYLDKRRLVTVVNCRGKWTIAAFQRVLNGFDIDYKVVHDSDGNPDDEGANARIGNLMSDSGEVYQLEPNLEEEFFNDSWESQKPWRATKTIMDSDEVPQAAQEYFEFVIGYPISSLSNEDSSHLEPSYKP